LDIGRKKTISIKILIVDEEIILEEESETRMGYPLLMSYLKPEPSTPTVGAMRRTSLLG
jgi:hypothetical protein